MSPTRECGRRNPFVVVRAARRQANATKGARDAAIAWLSVIVGLTNNEIRALRTEDYSRERARLWVRDVRGSRVIDLSRAGGALVEQWIQRRPEGSAHLFVGLGGRNGGGALRDRTIRRLLAELDAAADPGRDPAANLDSYLLLTFDSTESAPASQSIKSTLEDLYLGSTDGVTLRFSLRSFAGPVLESRDRALDDEFEAEMGFEKTVGDLVVALLRDIEAARRDQTYSPSGDAKRRLLEVNSVYGGRWIGEKWDEFESRIDLANRVRLQTEAAVSALAAVFKDARKKFRSLSKKQGRTNAILMARREYYVHAKAIATNFRATTSIDEKEEEKYATSRKQENRKAKKTRRSPKRASKSDLEPASQKNRERPWLDVAKNWERVLTKPGRPGERLLKSLAAEALGVARQRR